MPVGGKVTVLNLPLYKAINTAGISSRVRMAAASGAGNRLAAN
jgi:hypothetical protein